MERLTGVITDGAVTSLAPLDESSRRELLTAYEAGPIEARDLHLVCLERDRPWAEWLCWTLDTEGWPARVNVMAADSTDRIRALLSGTALVLAVVTAEFARSAVGAEIIRAQQSANFAPGWISVVPVIAEKLKEGPLVRASPRIDLAGLTADQAYEEAVAAIEALRLPPVGAEDLASVPAAATSRPMFPGTMITDVTLELTVGGCRLLGPDSSQLAGGAVPAPPPSLSVPRVTCDAHAAPPRPPGSPPSSASARFWPERCLHPDVISRLKELVTAAERHGVSLSVALAVGDSELTAMPWELLTLPGEESPLALGSSVHLFRRVPGGGAMPPIPGPLRMLVVLASPDSTPSLDLEAELGGILDAVEPARPRAHVRVLNQGTRTAIADALAREPFHVLHLACHGAPAVLLLETEDGQTDRIGAADLADLILRSRAPRLVVLLGDHGTGLPADEGPPIPEALVGAGVPQVISMTQLVSDEYATAFVRDLYRRLATQPDLDVQAAFAAACQHLGLRYRETGLGRTMPALYQAGPSRPLFDPNAVSAPVLEEPVPVIEGLRRVRWVSLSGDAPTCGDCGDCSAIQSNLGC